MSDNTSNTSNARRRVRKVKTAGTVGMALFEAFVLAELLWYYLHDEQQTLHGAVAEWFESLRQRAEHRAQVDSTLDMIRDLPETDDDA